MHSRTQGRLRCRNRNRETRNFRGVLFTDADECLDGWLAGWMDGWSDGWVDGWMNEWMLERVRKTPVYNAYVHGRLGASSSGEKKTCSRAEAEARGENRRTGDAQNPNVICNIHQRRRYVDDGIMRRVYTGIVNAAMRIYIVIMRRIIQEVVSADCVIAQLYSLLSLVHAFLSFPFRPVVPHYSLFTKPLLYRKLHSHL